VAASQKSFHFLLKISLNKNNFYTSPLQKPTSFLYYIITAPKKRLRGKSEKKRALMLTMQIAKY